MKTSELTGAALDWAVAKCEGVNEEAFQLFYDPTDESDLDSHRFPEFHYSTTWSQGGPIIEREGISTVCDDGDDYWQAVTNANSGSMFGPGLGGRYYQTGPTPLIAAMRCYVASKLGEEVDLPAGLE